MFIPLEKNQPEKGEKKVEMMNRNLRFMGNILSWLLASFSVLLVMAAGYAMGGWLGILLISILWVLLYCSVS
ncbi:hypothetical protein P4361_02950 [Fictibacillus sp. B-59209]|uniref:hypothetical protein n=1 Tax=Fictibacillus sp. B-59209 TaxID=3024873 RepID=UPI002E1E7415|nr:hypothetical protein [Fictibacillus sp. B-59209]